MAYKSRPRAPLSREVGGVSDVVDIA